MQKTILILALYIVIAQSYIGNCPCGSSHAFNSGTYTCDKYPSPNQKGYIEGCQEYTIKRYYGEWECKKCQPAYNLGKGYCISNGIQGCKYAQKVQNNQVAFLSFNDIQYKCQVCIDGYYIDDYTCVRYPKKGDKDYIQGCSSYYSRHQCFQCEQGYYLIHDICKKAEVNIPNCIQYGHLKNCLSCQEGFILVDQQQCLKPDEIIQNCKVGTTYFLNNNCVECNPGYYLDYNIDECIAYPKTVQEGKIDNCKIYEISFSGHLQCGQCNDTHVLSEDRQACEDLDIQPVEDCAQYQNRKFNGQECVECSQGFNIQMEEPYCKKCPINPDQHQIIQENQ